MVLHEFGHPLGLEHSDDGGVLAETLAPGVRRVPIAGTVVEEPPLFATAPVLAIAPQGVPAGTHPDEAGLALALAASVPSGTPVELPPSSGPGDDHAMGLSATAALLDIARGAAPGPALDDGRRALLGAAADGTLDRVFAGLDDNPVQDPLVPGLPRVPGRAGKTLPGILACPDGADRNISPTVHCFYLKL